MRKTYHEKFLEIMKTTNAFGIKNGSGIEDVFRQIKDIDTSDRPLGIQEFANLYFKVMPDYMSSLQRFSEEEKSTIMNGFLQNYYFWKLGKKVYHLSDAITSALIMTDVDNFPTEYIKMPHQSFYISIPNNYFTVEDPSTGIHPVYGIFVTSDEEADCFHWRILITADRGSRAENEYDDSLFFYRCRIQKGVPVKDSFSVEGTDMFSKDRPYYQDQIRDTMKFIFNFIVYLDTGITPVFKKDPPPPCTTQKPKKIERWKREYGNQSSMGFYDISDPELEDLFKSGEMPNGNISSRITFKLKWIVRGHWHGYWMGQGRSEFKHKWLKPYWKGKNRVEALDGDEIKKD